MLLSLHPNIIVHVENVVSLFSSPSTSSQKVQKCGGHKFVSHTVCCLHRLYGGEVEEEDTGDRQDGGPSSWPWSVYMREKVCVTCVCVCVCVCVSVSVCV